MTTLLSISPAILTIFMNTYRRRVVVVRVVVVRAVDVDRVEVVVAFDARVVDVDPSWQFARLENLKIMKKNTFKRYKILTLANRTNC
jgi:hypothetical protein